MDYSAQIATANRLVSKYGALVTYTQCPREATEGWLPTSDTPGIPYPGTPIVQVNAGVARYFREQFKITIDPSITVGTIQALMPGGLAFTPQFRDIVAWTDGSTYSLTDFDVIAPNGTPVLYYLTLNEMGTT